MAARISIVRLEEIQQKNAGYMEKHKACIAAMTNNPRLAYQILKEIEWLYSRIPRQVDEAMRLRRRLANLWENAAKKIQEISAKGDFGVALEKAKQLEDQWKGTPWAEKLNAMKSDLVERKECQELMKDAAKMEKDDSSEALRIYRIVSRRCPDSTEGILAADAVIRLQWTGRALKPIRVTQECSLGKAMHWSLAR